MSSFLPTLSSDDENDEEVGVVFTNKDSINKRGNKDVTIISNSGIENQEDSEEDTGEDSADEDEMEMNHDFDFDGIGDAKRDYRYVLGTHQSKPTWSYKSALELLAENDAAVTVERTEVSNIIAAARANMLLKEKEKAQKIHSAKITTTESEDRMSESEDEDDETKSHDNNDDKSVGEGESKTSNSEASDSDDDDGDDMGDHPAYRAEHIIDKDTVVTRTQEEEEEQKVDLKRVKKAKEQMSKEKKSKVRESDAHSSDEEGVGGVDAEALEESEKAAKFFDSTAESCVPNLGLNGSNEDELQFSQMALCRPLLRAVAGMGYVTPTPVQARCLPLALGGRDICASAVTGSGKTAAFLLPVLEKIMQRKQHYGSGRNADSCTRALILCPTRELAAQVLSMMTALIAYIRPEGFITGSLIVGGAKNIKSQSLQLKARPDVIVATPGRLIDHLLNTASFTLGDIEFLVMDEADRLLELGFQDEITEIIKSCPKQRQTLLFSATLDSTKIDDLIKLSLKRPVRVAVSTKGGSRDKSRVMDAIEVAPRLEQEFVRIRSGNEEHREAIFLSLLTRTFANQRVIGFFDTKAVAHRIRILAGLLGITCTELHGDLTQQQRLEALESFRSGDVNVMLATDLAGRGIDIPDVDAVLNFDMPSQVSKYVHRIGRTARAGRGGRSCTLIGEGRRHLMKEVIKDAEEKNNLQKETRGLGEVPAAPTAVIRTRTVPPAVVLHFAEKIKSLEDKVNEVKLAEKVAKLDRIAELEAIRAQNIIEHQDEIKSQPRREWFVGDNEKEEQANAAAELEAAREEKRRLRGTHGMSRKKRRAYEARQAMLEAQKEAKERKEETGQDAKKVMTQENLKLHAKAHKKKEREKQKDSLNKSIREEDEIARIKKSHGKRKGITGSTPIGDASLFEDERVTYSKKSKLQSSDQTDVVKSSYKFRNFDPDKKFGKGGKKGTHKFKSKSKFKRSR